MNEQPWRLIVARSEEVRARVKSATGHDLTWEIQRIGVMVDDLVTRGVSEPYRMFTSRAEYRLLLREDNADLRLTVRGRDMGLVNDARWAHFSEKREAIEREQGRMTSTWIHPCTPQAEALARKLKKPLSHEYSMAELLKRPELTYFDIAGLIGEASSDPQVAEQVEIQAKYAGYIDRQQDDIARLRRYESTILPVDLDYEEVDGLSNEVKQKLAATRPDTLARAGRVPGITPAAISLLLVYLKRRNAFSRVPLGEAPWAAPIRSTRRNYCCPGTTAKAIWAELNTDLLTQLQRGCAALELALEPRQEALLLDYLEMLRKWNSAYNLTAVREPGQMVTRHLLDSLAMAPHLRGKTVIDVGTGAGLPGIPLAILYPRRDFSLLDSNGKKTRFLFQVKTALRLDNMQVHHQRVESFRPSAPFEAVTSRAFASLADMVAGCRHLLAGNGRFFAMKGTYPEQELAALDPACEVVAVHSLEVPGLAEQRHLVELKMINRGELR